MQYVTSVERIGIEKGMEKGMEIGMEIGMEKGMLKGEQKILRRQLERRFQTLPDWAIELIAQASEAEFEQWLDNILDATSIDVVFTEPTAAH